MFDTVEFRTKRQKPSASELERLGFTKPFDGSGLRWFWNPPAGSYLPSMTWNTSQSGDYLTVLKVSLPKFLYGNNVETIKTEAEVMRAVDGLSSIVSGITERAFDLRSWDVVRLDICHVWDLTEKEVAARIRALGGAHVKRMTPDPSYPHGMYWKTDSGTLVAYSKHSDVSAAIRKGEDIPDEVLQASIGKFRLERRFTDRPAVKRRIVKPFELGNERAENVLRADIAASIINEDIMALNLDKPLESGDERKARLLDRCQGFNNKFFRLSAFLDAYADPYLREQMRSKMNAETFRNYRRDLEAAGVLLDNPQPETYAALSLARYGEVSRAGSDSITIQPTQKFLESEWVN